MVVGKADRSGSVAEEVVNGFDQGLFAGHDEAPAPAEPVSGFASASGESLRQRVLASRGADCRFWGERCRNWGSFPRLALKVVTSRRPKPGEQGKRDWAIDLVA